MIRLLSGGIFVAVAAAIAGLGYLQGHTDGASGRSLAIGPALAGPALAAPVDHSVISENSDLDVYYPGTEELAADEMRVVA